MSRRGTGPDFICIGAMKAGTSWLYRALAGHPQVSLPPTKEIHFFDEAEEPATANFLQRLLHPVVSRNRRWQRVIWLSLGRRLLTLQARSGWWFCRYLFSRRALDAKALDSYAGLFDAGGEGGVQGDITPSYALLRSSTVAAIRQRFPAVKIVYLLRDPVDRDLSELSMSFRDRRVRPEQRTSAGEVQKLLAASRHGDYHGNLERWLQHFDPAQIHVDFFEEIRRQPSGVMERICGFLGIESIEFPAALLSEKVNASSRVEVSAEARAFLRSKYASQTERLAALLKDTSLVSDSRLAAWRKTID